MIIAAVALAIVATALITAAVMTRRLRRFAAAAQDLVELAALERAATLLIDQLTERLTDAIRERREFLSRP